MEADLQAVTWRLDLLSLAVAELARALPAQEATRAADAITHGMANRIADHPICEGADATLAADLAFILAALRRR